MYIPLLTVFVVVYASLICTCGMVSEYRKDTIFNYLLSLPIIVKRSHTGDRPLVAVVVVAWMTP